MNAERWQLLMDCSIAETVSILSSFRFAYAKVYLTLDDLQCVVGQGQNAVVCRALDKRSGSVVALKMFDCSRQGTEDIQAELRAYSKLDALDETSRK